MELPSMLQTRLFPIKKGSDRPMFLVHGIGGTALLFPTLAKFLPENRAIYALQAKGLDGVTPIDDRIESLAVTYIEAIRGVQAEGPYQIAGYSHGSHIAFEMAQQLQANGEEVSFLGVIDHPAPSIEKGRVFHAESSLSSSLKRYTSKFVTMAKSGKTSNIMPAIKRRLKAHSSGGTYNSVEDIIDMTGWPEQVKKVARVHFEASLHYEPKPYPGIINLFTTPNSVANPEGWELLAENRVKVHQIPGSHETIFYEPYVQKFCEVLDELLD